MWWPKSIFCHLAAHISLAKWFLKCSFCLFIFQQMSVERFCFKVIKYKTFVVDLNIQIFQRFKKICRILKTQVLILVQSCTKTKSIKLPEYMIKISIFYEFWVKILRKFISWFPSFGTQGDDISRSIEVVANQFKDSPTILLLQ